LKRFRSGEAIGIPFRCSFQKFGIRWGLFEKVVSLLLLREGYESRTGFEDCNQGRVSRFEESGPFQERASAGGRVAEKVSSKGSEGSRVGQGNSGG
jgi:hypothetical protein